MQEVFEKIIEKFSNIHRVVENDEDLEWNRAVYKCTEIVQQVATEYDGGWIPTSEKLPEVNKMVLLYAPYMEYEPISIGCLWQGTDENRVPYFRWFAHWEDNDTTKGGLHYSIGCPYICPGSEYVIAWQPLPEPYQPKGE